MKPRLVSDHFHDAMAELLFNTCPSLVEHPDVFRAIVWLCEEEVRYWLNREQHRHYAEAMRGSQQ